MQPGASVARVARQHGVNANQVFYWRNLYRQGRLGEKSMGSISLLPVTVTDARASRIVEPQAKRSGNHSGRDLRRVSQSPSSHRRQSRCSSTTCGAGVSAAMIELPAKTYIWIAAGVTDMRRGFQGLSALVQTKLEQSPFSGHVFVFRGRRGDLIKVLWWDGDGLCLFAKRLERGRFIWPKRRTAWFR